MTTRKRYEEMSSLFILCMDMQMDEAAISIAERKVY